MNRFTAWLSEGERADIKRVAVRYEVSENFVVRLAIRRLLTAYADTGNIFTTDTTDKTEGAAK